MSGPPITPPKAKRTTAEIVRRDMLAVAIALAVIILLAGLAFVAYVIIMIAAFSSWGSNK